MKSEMRVASQLDSSHFLSNLCHEATHQLQSANPSRRQKGYEVKEKLTEIQKLSNPQFNLSPHCGILILYCTLYSVMQSENAWLTAPLPVVHLEYPFHIFHTAGS